MKHIYVNFKRFDVPAGLGGVNRLATAKEWAKKIVAETAQGLTEYSGQNVEFAMFFPEAHIIMAHSAIRQSKSPVALGCQGVYRKDIEPGGNFGAFTTNRPAAAAKAMGCTHTIIGHCEERRDIAEVLAQAGVQNDEAVDKILNSEIICAQKQGIKVLYCIGETEAEHSEWQNVLAAQLCRGLAGVNTHDITIAYEPVWAIGPGKTPPDKDYIAQAAGFIKQQTNGLPVVYGGGLKADNAAMLAEIPEIDGGLIALTRFSGDIGFYPDEYLEIVKLYLQNTK